MAEWARFSGERLGTAILVMELFRLRWGTLGDFELDEKDVVRPNVVVRDVVEPFVDSRCVAGDSLLVLGLVEVGVLLPPNFENRPPPCVDAAVRCISARLQG